MSEPRSYMPGQQAVRRKDGSYVKPKPKPNSRNVAIQSLGYPPKNKSTDDGSNGTKELSIDLFHRLRMSTPIREYDDPNDFEPRFINYDPKGLIWALRRLQLNEATLTNDIIALILLYLDWGPKTDKIYKLIDKDLLDRSRQLIARYDVVSGPGKMSDKVITLDLISYAFPEVTANLLHTNQGKVVGKLGPLPRALASPSGASLIPKTWKNMNEAWRLWAKRFIAIISKNVPENEKRNYFKFLINTEFQDGDKLAILRHFGITRDLKD